ncbi:HmuY family protein [Cystobacter fuscus]
MDARAGGAATTQSYTYGHFTPQGLSRVAVDDQAALASTDWDIALRRYTIRVNSGVSGPSCVAVARTPAGTSFESVTAVDTAWEFRTEDYFTESCEPIPGQYDLGLATRLEDFWGYEACLSMTDAVFVLRLADGRHVKLQVTHYYEPEPQRVCDETGEVPQPSGAAQLRVRWAFLP